MNQSPLHYPVFHITRIGDGNLFAASKPPATHLAAAFQELKSRNIAVVLSLLEPAEAVSLHLQNEAYACDKVHLSYFNFPIPDFGVPAIESLHDAVGFHYKQISKGADTVVHCRGGIGRTGTVCSCLLVKHGMNVQDAIALVTHQRGETVPETAEQIAAVTTYANMISGSAG